MRITRNGHLIQLSFMPRMFPVNCYLVEEDDGLTLLDAALPYSWKGIMRAARELGKPVVRIVLTHGHEDHVGALDRLKAEWPNALVHISERDARLLAGDRSLLPGEPALPIRGGVPKTIKTRPEVLIGEGDRIGSLAVLAAPGHTPGSMAFLDTRSQALIAGDAFQTRGGTAVAGQLRPLFPFPAMATWDREQALDSAVKLLKTEPSLLAVGHGPMLPQPGAAMQAAIAAAERRLAAQAGRERRLD